MQAALTEYRTAIECDPRNAYYHFKLPEMPSVSQVFVPEAIGELEASVELEPVVRSITSGLAIFISWPDVSAMRSVRCSKQRVRTLRRLLLMRLGVLYMWASHIRCRWRAASGGEIIQHQRYLSQPAR